MFILRTTSFAEAPFFFVRLRCLECDNVIEIKNDYFEKISPKYVILKEGVNVTCDQCGSTQPEDERYLPLEPQTINIPIPKCPTCGSTKVEKISTAKKVVGFAMVGVFSSNLGKTMHCKQCGYKW